MRIRCRSRALPATSTPTMSAGRPGAHELRRRRLRAQQAELAALPPARHQQPGEEGDHRDRDAGPRELAGEGDDDDVDGGELSAGYHRTIPPQPLGVGVEGDRGAATGAVDHDRRWQRAARPAAPHPSRPQAGDCRRPAGRGGDDRRAQTQARPASSGVRGSGTARCRRPAFRSATSRVMSAASAAARSAGTDVGVVRQDEHEVVAATERGADLIDWVSRVRCRRRRRARRESASVDRTTVLVGLDDDAEECGGEDLVGVARHAHRREQVTGGVAPHPCRGRRVLVQEVDDRRTAVRRPGNSSDPVAVADDVRPYSAGGSAGSSATSSSSPLRSRDVSTGAGGPPAASTWRSANSRTNAGASIPADSSVNMAKMKTWSRLANTNVASPLSPTCEPGADEPAGEVEGGFGDRFEAVALCGEDAEHGANARWRGHRDNGEIENRVSCSNRRVRDSAPKVFVASLDEREAGSDIREQHVAGVRGCAGARRQCDALAHHSDHGAEQQRGGRTCSMHRS